MKRLLLAGIAALLLVAPMAAQHRRVVVVSPAFGWGWYEPYWGPYLMAIMPLLPLGK